MANLPPTGVLFAAFLGYNPLATLIPTNVLDTVSETTRTTVLGNSFFPSLLSKPFMDGVTIAFLISALLSLIAAFASIAGGRRFVHDVQPVPVTAATEPTMRPS